MDKVLIFDFMNKDNTSSHVEANFKTREVTCIDYTDVPHRMAFAKRPKTIANVNFFFSRRCFPEARPDCKELLEHLGLKEYNPLDIVRNTHGVMTHDDSWVRFDGEDLKYDDVRIR